MSEKIAFTLAMIISIMIFYVAIVTYTDITLFDILLSLPDSMDASIVFGF